MSSIFYLKKASIWQMIILQAGQTIPDPNNFCDPRHFGENFYSVGYTENRVLSQLFLWTPTFRGKLYSVGYTENRVSSQLFCDHKILEALSRSKKEEALWSWKNKVFTYDPELPKCLLMIICGQSAREETLEILSSEPASVAGVRFVLSRGDSTPVYYWTSISIFSD